MKNTICEKLMWLAMTPTIFKYINECYEDIDIKQVKDDAKRNYKAMVERTPDIGSFTKNSLRVCLVGGIVWLSVYDSMNGKMSREKFAEMIKVTMRAPLIREAFRRKNPFNSEYQKKKAEKDKIANSMWDSEFNWKTETIPGRDPDEYQTNYYQCGLCALGKQEHHEDLILYMCEMDFLSIELMGGVLHRKGTIADGAKVCDFYVCKKGSKWDV